MKEKAH